MYCSTLFSDKRVSARLSACFATLEAVEAQVAKPLPSWAATRVAGREGRVGMATEQFQFIETDIIR